MMPGEPDALVLYWQISVLEVRTQEVTVGYVIVYYHTVLWHYADSHSVDCSDLGL